MRPIQLFLLVVYLSFLLQSSGRKNFLADELPVSWTICKGFAGLTKSQQKVCRKYPDVTSVAMQGLETAVDECQFQFRADRWNCSSLKTKNRNPRTSILLQKGYRESAFSYAISAAGVVHSVARACSMGKLMACGCEPKILKQKNNLSPDQQMRRSRRNRWKWGGCSHNMDFGVEFSKMFLDKSAPNGNDMQSAINLHNNEAGRLAVLSQLEVRCKCHGMSGSCELKTCWRSAPDFRAVGDALKERYRRAVLVDRSNIWLQDNLPPPRRSKRRDPRIGLREGAPRDLLYYEKSPDYCDKDVSVDFPGTVGRQCNRTSRGTDNCSSLCCGRGYSQLRQKRVEKCRCRFQWCCYVLCDNCTVHEWVTVCN